MRRGAKSANARWDNTIAILTGDFLFAHASRLVAGLGPEAVRIIAETFAELVTGQIRETAGPRAGRGPDRAPPDRAGREDRLADRHLARATAAMFSGAPASRWTALRRYGERGRRWPSRSPTTSSTSPRDRRLGQDAGHRPARGRPTPAGAVRAGRATGRRGGAPARPGCRGPGSARRRGRRGPGSCCVARPACTGPRGPRRARRRRPAPSLPPSPDGPARRALAALPRLHRRAAPADP